MCNEGTLSWPKDPRLHVLDIGEQHKTSATECAVGGMEHACKTPARDAKQAFDGQNSVLSPQSCSFMSTSTGTSASAASPCDSLALLARCCDGLCPCEHQGPTSTTVE